MKRAKLRVCKEVEPMRTMGEAISEIWGGPAGIPLFSNLSEMVRAESNGRIQLTGKTFELFSILIEQKG